MDQLLKTTSFCPLRLSPFPFPYFHIWPVGTSGGNPLTWSHLLYCSEPATCRPSQVPSLSLASGTAPSPLPSPTTSVLLSFHFQMPPCLFGSNQMFHKIFSHGGGMSRILKAPKKNTPDFASSLRDVYMLFPSLECPLPSTTLCSQGSLRTLGERKSDRHQLPFSSPPVLFRHRDVGCYRPCDCI